MPHPGTKDPLETPINSNSSEHLEKLTSNQNPSFDVDPD
jgi:Na+/melibiose symporter-like transporter